MTIRIEIFGENHTEIRESLAGLASFLLGGTAQAAVAAAPEPVAEAPARRGRKKADAPTIDHDPNEGKKDDVGAGDDGVSDSAVAVDGRDVGSGDETSASSSESSDAVSTEQAGPAEAEKAEAASDLTIDDLRAYTITSYLNVVTDSLPKRKELYAALLEEFEIEPDDKGIRAITRLPAGKIGAFKVSVDNKIAEAMKG